MDPLGRGGRRLAGERRRGRGEHDIARRARDSRRAPPGAMALEASAPPRILILRRDNIGDLVCTTPLIDALRARHPQAWLGALVNTYNADVLAGNGALDAVHVYEKLKHRSGSLLSNLFRRMRLASTLRGAKLDYVLAPSAWPQALK